MKRYIPIAAVIVFVIAALAFGNHLLVLKKQAAAQAAYEAERHLVVYSDMPEDVNRNLAAAFHKRTGLRVQIQTRTDDELYTLWRSDGKEGPPAVLIASEPVLREQKAHQVLRPYASQFTESVPYPQKDSDAMWTGLWLDPMVFIIHNEYYARRGMYIRTWDDLLTDPTLQVAFPDLAATDMAGDFLCSFVEVKGTEAAGLYLKALQSHISMYSKVMAANVRRVAGGEADIGIVDGATARQYRQDGMPIYIVYPRDGTSYWLTGAAVTKWCRDDELAQAFMDWLYSRDVDDVLRGSHLYLTYANSDARKILDSRGQELILFPVQKQYTGEGRRTLQDWWIKSVRFGKGE